MSEALKPLIVPRTNVRHVRHHSLHNRRWAKLEALAAQADVRRPGAGATPAKPSIGALLEALAAGKIGIVRMDDPERRVMVGDVSPCGEGPRIDPRDPRAWDE